MCGGVKSVGEPLSLKTHDTQHLLTLSVIRAESRQRKRVGLGKNGTAVVEHGAVSFLIEA